MTVATEKAYAELAWTGDETQFAPGFAAMAAADVKVSYRDAGATVTPLTETIEYEISLGAGVGARAVTVIPLAMPAPPGDVLIERITPATQPTDFGNLGSYSGDVHTQRHDEAALRDGEIRRKANLMEDSSTIAVEAAAAAAASEAAAAAFAAAAGAGVFLTDTFNGDGVETVFDLGIDIANLARVIWIEGGVAQIPGVDFTIAGTELTRTTPPANGVPIIWYLLGKIEGVNQRTAPISILLDGAGSPIPAGLEVDISSVPFSGTIKKWTAIADQAGSIQVDVWADSFANAPPDNADSITASAPIAIVAAAKAEDATLTGWTTVVAAGTAIRFHVDSADTITRCSIVLTIEKD